MILTKPVYSNVTGELVGYAQGFFELSSYIDVSNKLLETLIFLEIIGVILSLVLGFYYLVTLQVLLERCLKCYTVLKKLIKLERECLSQEDKMKSLI